MEKTSGVKLVFEIKRDFMNIKRDFMNKDSRRIQRIFMNREDGEGV